MMREAIVSAARDEIGTPFRHQGRIPGKALDCAGLLIVVASRVGLDYKDQDGYAKRPSGGLLEAALDMQPCLESISIDQMQAGDVLLMRFDVDPQHLAIYVGFSETYQDDGIIHALTQARKVCEHRLTDEWKRRIVRVYRFVEVA